MKKTSSGRNLDANLEMLSFDIFVQALHMPRSNISSGVYLPQYKKKRTSRLSRSASIRVHVEVRNGQGRARDVGPPPEDGDRTRRFDRGILVPRILY